MGKDFGGMKKTRVREKMNNSETEQGSIRHILVKLFTSMIFPNYLSPERK